MKRCAISLTIRHCGTIWALIFQHNVSLMYWVFMYLSFYNEYLLSFWLSWIIRHLLLFWQIYSALSLQACTRNNQVHYVGSEQADSNYTPRFGVLLRQSLGNRPRGLVTWSFSDFPAHFVLKCYSKLFTVGCQRLTNSMAIWVEFQDDISNVITWVCFTWFAHHMIRDCKASIGCGDTVELRWWLEYICATDDTIRVWLSEMPVCIYGQTSERQI